MSLLEVTVTHIDQQAPPREPNSPDAPVLRYAAFTDAGTGGNPAGVVLNASGMTDVDRLAVAARVGYSETAFVEPAGQEGHYRVRYFSPQAEVAFCGHATIATAVALAERRGPGLLHLTTRAGPVTVRTSRAAGDPAVTATLTSVPTRTRPAGPGEVDPALTALGWQPGELDPRYPPHVAHAGNDHLVLTARERSRLAALDYNFPALQALMTRQGWTTLQLVWAQDPTTFHSRNPFPPGGVVEDPATGAAAAALGGYLRDLRLVELPARVTVLQGAEMGRPSRLLVDISAEQDRVQVTGTASAIPDPPTGARPADVRLSTAPDRKDQPK